MELPMRDIQEVAMATNPMKLKKGLKHPNEAVRFWAAYNLGNEKDNSDYQKALPFLGELLQDPVPVVRLAAARAICKMSSPGGTIKTITDELKNEDEWVRLYAALVLDELGESSRPVIEDLNGVMDDSNKYVVRVANHALNYLQGTNNVVR
jgi:HEAT repeat protein